MGDGDAARKYGADTCRESPCPTVLYQETSSSKAWIGHITRVIGSRSICREQKWVRQSKPCRDGDLPFMKYRVQIDNPCGDECSESSHYASIVGIESEERNENV